MTSDGPATDPISTSSNFASTARINVSLLENTWKPFKIYHELNVSLELDKGLAAARVPASGI